MRIALVLSLVAGLASAAERLDLFVSPAGNDAASGREDTPFATLERARDEIRSSKVAGERPVIVHVGTGVYWRGRTFELSAADSGSEFAPIEYRGNGGARMVGGRGIERWKPVTDPGVLKRLDPVARGHVVETDLKAVGITGFGSLTPRGFGRPVVPAGLELFYRDRPMKLAQWPNEGYVRIADVPAGAQGGRFTYEGDRPRRWEKANDVWLHGYWTWDWAESYEKVKGIDVEKREIATEPPHGVYGYAKGKRWRALNLLEELDSPGEWYLDRKSGKLYFWPPDAEKGEIGPVTVSLINDMVSLRDVSYVTLRGIGLEAMRGNGVAINGGSHNAVVACTIRNIGNQAVVINGSPKSGVEGCDISEAGDGGIFLSGGDRKALTAAGLYAVNNHIWNFSRWDKTYRPAVSVSGVGQRVANNLIHDSPHMAIALAGNEHVIDLNEVHHVCMETDDVGAFYMGRDWTQRGNVVRHNYFHDIGGIHSKEGSNSVYLDDWSSGTAVFGNIIVKGGRGVLIGGGRDNTVENNTFVDCTPGVHIDQRGLGWAKYYFDGNDNTLVDRLNAMPFKAPPWSTRYPELLKLYADEPAKAKGNRVIRNISVRGRWLDLLDGLKESDLLLKDNIVGDDACEVDAARRQVRLKDGSPAQRLGFQRVPFERMGLQR